MMLPSPRRPRAPLVAVASLGLFAAMSMAAHGCDNGSAATVGGAGGASYAGRGGRPAGGGHGNPKGGSGYVPDGAAGIPYSGDGGQGGAGAAGGAVGKSPNDVGGSCGTLERPEAVPPDWEVYTGFSCLCRFYLPGEKGAPPEPMTWEDCPAGTNAPPTCRAMSHPWNNVTEFIQPNVFFSRDVKSGTPFIQFTRNYLSDEGKVDVYYHVVAEPDGVVRSAAMTKLFDPACQMSVSGLSENRYIMRIWGEPYKSNTRQGYVAGTVGERAISNVGSFPREKTSSFDWRVSSSWIVRVELGQQVATSWDGTESSVFYSPANDPDSFPAYDATAQGGDLFTEAHIANFSGIWAWSKEHGSRPLLRWPGDFTRSAGNFATDGTDMVWTYAEGKTDPDVYDLYKKMSIMTAPYTTDPAVARRTSRRLRSDPVQLFSVYPFAVGYGYAAHPVSIDGNSTDMLIVRLADGFSWVLRGDAVPGPFGFGPALGFSRDELFANANYDTPSYCGGTIVRIRLDSLGPGTPPD